MVVGKWSARAGRRSGGSAEVSRKARVGLSPVSTGATERRDARRRGNTLRTRRRTACSMTRESNKNVRWCAGPHETTNNIS
jgi:hypothetical protein